MADLRPGARLIPAVSIVSAAALLMMALMNLSDAVQVAKPELGNKLVPEHGAIWGAWVAPVNGQSDAQAVAIFESTVSRPLDIVHQYHAWDDTWPTATEYSWAAGGRIIFANASARQRSGAVLTWTQIADGSQDSIINALAARLKAFGSLLFFSFDEEPEERYHSNPSAYTLASFASAYRHIHSVFAADGATNVVWVWNVTGYSGNEAIYPQLYPGDAYVDWIGWDPYNWFNCHENTTNVWQSFDTIISPFYNWVSAGQLSTSSPSKPYMLAEYGTVENTDSPTKGQWFTSEVSSLPNRPNIKAVVYFNENRDCNWPVTTSSSSLGGFTAAGLNCYVNRALPSPPSSVSASPGNSTVEVSWTLAGSVCPVTTYTIIASPGGERISVAGDILSASFGGLANGTTYTFQVTATSVNGTSGVSPSSAGVTPVSSQLSTSPNPSAQPSLPPTAVKPSASSTTGAPKQTASPAVRDVARPIAWLQANEFAIPISLAVLLGAGFGAHFIRSRSRRRRR